MDGNETDGSGDSRRDFMKKGALASGAVALGLGSSGSAVAQEDGGDDDDILLNDEKMDCIMYQNDFRPEAEFIITTPVVDWTPNAPANLGSPFEGYNTRMISYRNTGDKVLFFQAQDAQIPNYSEEAGYVVDDDESFGENEFTQPEVYSLWNEASFYEGTNRLVKANFSPVEEDYENSLFEGEGFDENDGWLW
ncbi:twin-arginine translocation signal domain-containing protein [Halopelagius fulvigenes]